MLMEGGGIESCKQKRCRFGQENWSCHEQDTVQGIYE